MKVDQTHVNTIITLVWGTVKLGYPRTKRYLLSMRSTTVICQLVLQRDGVKCGGNYIRLYGDMFQM